MSKSTKSKFFWPAITDTESAKRVSRTGFWAAVFVGAMTAGMAILGGSGIAFQEMGMDYWVLFDAFVFAALAWGIWKLSRIAAFCGLTLYLAERVYMWSVIGPRNPVVAFIITMAFIQGVRGTIKYHRLSAAEKLENVSGNGDEDGDGDGDVNGS